MSNGLPAGWTEATLADVCVGVPQRGPDPDAETFPYIDLGAIDNKAKRIAVPSRVATAAAPSRAKQVVASGDVVFSTVRVYLENIALVPAELDGAIASTAFTVLRPRECIAPGYLYRLVSSKRFVRAVNALQRGNSPPSVQDADVRGQRVPLPPFAEQQRIVSRIEELFSEIDEGERALERVSRLVERYRQSVLKAAVTGELTRGRSSGPGLPADWSLRSLANLSAEKPTNGVSVKGRDSPPGVAALRLDAITEVGFDFGARRFIPISAEKAEKLGIKRGDFFVSRANGSLQLVGRGVLASQPPCLTVFPDTMIRYRLGGSEALSRWVAMVWSSGWIRRQIEAKAKTTAGIHKISQTDIAEITFPVPPTEGEMFQAVDAVAKQSGAWRSLIQELNDRQRESAALRQSVLKAAFSGQLVPQDPSDEPAAALLARLASQSARAPAVPKRRGRAPRQPAARA